MKRQFMVGYMWVKLTLHVNEHYLETSIMVLGGVGFVAFQHFLEMKQDVGRELRGKNPCDQSPKKPVLTADSL